MPSCLTVGEVNQFFRNTLKRNRTGLRPDVLVVSSDLVTNDPVSSDLDVERVNNVAPNNSCDVLSNQLNNTALVLIAAGEEAILQHVKLQNLQV